MKNNINYFRSGMNVLISKAVLLIIIIFLFSSLIFVVLMGNGKLQNFFGIIPISCFLCLSIILFLKISKYEVNQDGIIIGSNQIPWKNIYEVNMYFQSRKIIIIKYLFNDKITTSILLATEKDISNKFIPREFNKDYQTELESFIRSNILQ